MNIATAGRVSELPVIRLLKDLELPITRTLVWTMLTLLDVAQAAKPDCATL